MEDLTFSEYAKWVGLPRTTLYTKLNQLKKTNPERYDYFVLQNENTLKIRHERMDELKGFLQAEHKPVMAPRQDSASTEEVETLKKELEKSEEKYQRLFQEYMGMNQRLQETNERLLAVIEHLSQQVEVKQQESQAEIPVMNRSQIVLDDEMEDEVIQEEPKRFGRFF